MKSILFIFCILILVCSCYKDKGNYEYNEINQLEIGGKIDSVILCDQMDILHIPVELKGTQYDDTSRFSYTWEINKKEVAYTKDLNIYANFPLGEVVGRYIVTDKELGTKAFKVFKIKVSSSTAGDAILVLSKYKGHAELSFKRLDKANSVFTPNYYYDLVGNYLGTEPKKIHRNYVPEEGNKNSGLKIETDHKLKCLSDETLVEIGEDVFLDQHFFINRSMSYPPEVPVFDVQSFSHLTTGAEENSKGACMFLIANNELWHDQYMYMFGMSVNLTQLCKKSPLNGKFSSAFFLPSLKTSGAQKYETPELIYLFDETAGQFITMSLMSPSGSVCSEIGDYPGYRLMYGTHTASLNYAVAVLEDDVQSKILYLKLPAKANEANTIPPTLVGSADVSFDILNKTTSFYSMKNEGYLLYATGNKLYKYNLHNLENGIAPSTQDAIASLSDFGFQEDAEITCMAVTRTEQEVVLGVSRYGSDKDGMSDELKGDVLVLNMKTMELIKKYEGVSGCPVDVIIKYQKFLRDGKEDGSTVSDVLYF